MAKDLALKITERGHKLRKGRVLPELERAPHKGLQPPNTPVLTQGHPGANADLQNYKVLSVYFIKIMIIHWTDNRKGMPSHTLSIA